MRFFNSAALAVVSVLPFASAFHKGFNIAANRPDGSCKAQSDWEYNFNVMKSLPGGFRDVRVYASSDCNTLQNAVPAAIATGVQILVGVWAEDSNHYNAEKQALLNAAKQYGVGWISAISVGSEDLYRGDTSAQTLANQVYDVRGMMSTVGGKGIWVGHVDTWTAWVKADTQVLIAACDFVGMDGYPYFQASNINNAKSVFYQSLQATQNAINQVKSFNNQIGKAHLWITETGWPAAGPTYGGQSVASVQNAQTYWNQVLCSLFPNYATYAYTLRDYNVAPQSPSFGVVDANFSPIYNVGC